MTPPEEPTPVMGLPCMSSQGINPAMGGSAMSLNQQNDQMHTSIQINTPEPQQQSVSPSQHHLQGTIVWYNLMWGRRFVARNCSLNVVECINIKFALLDAPRYEPVTLINGFSHSQIDTLPTMFKY